MSWRPLNSRASAARAMTFGTRREASYFARLFREMPIAFENWTLDMPRASLILFSLAPDIREAFHRLLHNGGHPSDC